MANVVKSFDTVDRCVLDRVLCGLGSLGWFRHAYFEFHSHVRHRFKLAAGLGRPWTRDGVHSSGMSFEYDVYWCLVFALVWVSGCSGGVLRCMLIISSVLLGTLAYSCVLHTLLLGMSGWLLRSLLLVSVLMSTSRAVPSNMWGWVVIDEGHRWSVKVDVRDLGGHLDTTLHDWSSTLASRVRFAIARLILVFALPLDFHGRLRVLRSMFIPGAWYRGFLSCRGLYAEVAGCHSLGCLVSSAAFC